MPTAVTVIDLTEPESKTIIVDDDEMCCLCFDKVEDASTYYRPPCGHLFCYVCMDQYNQLNRCTRCNQDFIVAEPVKILVRNHVIVID